MGLFDRRCEPRLAAATLAAIMAIAPAAAQSIEEQPLALTAPTGPAASVPLELPATTPIVEETPSAPIDTRANPRTERVDGALRLRSADERDEDEDLGIRAGRFIIRPTLSQRIVGERSSSTGGTEDRVFSETQGDIEILSDWSRHALTVLGSTVHEENLSGDGQTDPSTDINATLRLDLADETTATLRAGYSFYREDETDPNALEGATTQAGVNAFTLGGEVARDLGIIRASLDLSGERTIFDDVRLSDGSSLDLGDRDQTSISLTGRATYNSGAALAPLVEAELTRSEYDEQFDRNGFERSAWSYGLRTGLAIDLGEKWSGEIAAGYALRDIDDPRLASVDALTVDGLLNWSPHRGTDVALGLITEIESSTTPDLPGSVAYRVYSSITHAIRSDIVARLGGGATLRLYDGSTFGDETIYDASVGLTWRLNRYLDLLADVGYERTTRDGEDDFDTTYVGMGVSLRR
ncbi:outer membrane beta-barrel protein [Pararhizobium haloflavum]|uniref:outer membrane beta-barrel protein n=1 Tax=Pararhizobium haloflavum TaxID=2037914 RepID=UPI0013000189|nr:outer membrane beta-barrel protein [Pararhizobium haloflavum]